MKRVGILFLSLCLIINCMSFPVFATGTAPSEEESQIVVEDEETSEEVSEKEENDSENEEEISSSENDEITSEDIEESSEIEETSEIKEEITSETKEVASEEDSSIDEEDNKEEITIPDEEKDKDVTNPSDGVDINEKNFPNETFRRIVKENFDNNSDGKLNPDELGNAWRINIFDFTNHSFSEMRSIDDLSGIEFFYNLKYLECGNCYLTKLDVSNNVYLERLVCYGNKLTSLDVSSNPYLQNLDFSGNAIEKIDLSYNPELDTLDCSSCNLKQLNLGEKLELRQLFCNGANNTFTVIDLSGAPKLRELVNDNTIEWQDNPYESCPTNVKRATWEVIYVNKNVSFTGLAIDNNDVEINKNNFPDDVIRQYVSDHFDEDHSGFLTPKERNNCYRIEIKDFQDITSLEGIEYFPNLHDLDLLLANCNFSSLDLSHNNRLQFVWIGIANQLNNVVLGAQPFLYTFDIKSERLSSLDISGAPALRELYCYDCNLISLDVSHNWSLVNLYCEGNPISSINVSNCYAIKDTILEKTWTVSQPTEFRPYTTKSVSKVDENNNSLGSICVNYDTAVIPEGNYNDGDCPPATSIKLNITSATMYTGGEMKLDTILTPSGASKKNIKWSVSDASVASVSYGTVRAKSVGKTVVTATTPNGLSATCDITVLCEDNPSNPFADIISDTWKYTAAWFVFYNGYMTGKGELIPGKTKFSPDSPITRAEFVQVLYSIEGKPSVTYKQKFKDVKAKDWFASSVTWAEQNKIVSGNPNGTFGVSSQATREQLATMFYQYAIYKGYDTTLKADGRKVKDFSDAKKVSSWALNAMDWAVSYGIISGTGAGKLNPKGNATRVECAAMIRSFENAFNQENAFSQIINKLRTRFPAGKYWNHEIKEGHDPYNPANDKCMDQSGNGITDHPCQDHSGNPVWSGYDDNWFDGASQCNGFAYKMYYEVYGEYASTKVCYDSNKDNIKPGDVVTYDGNLFIGSKWVPTDANYGHTVFVIAREGNNIKVAECNLDNQCGIFWDREIDLSSPMEMTNIRSVSRHSTN